MMYIDWEGLAQGVACDPYFNLTTHLGHLEDAAWVQYMGGYFSLVNTIYPNDLKDGFARNINIYNSLYNYGYPNNARKDTAITKFGAASAHLEHIPVQDRSAAIDIFVAGNSGAPYDLDIRPNLDPLTADQFTQECWFNINGTQVVHYTNFFRYPSQVHYNDYWSYFEVHLYDSTGTNPNLRNALALRFRDSSYAVTEYTATGLSVPFNTWHHLALVKHGVREFSLFLNGVRVISHVQSPATKPGPFNLKSLYFTGGEVIDGTNYMPYLRGNMDEMRVSIVARYDANFDVPTAAFPDIQCVYDPVSIPLTFYARDIPILDGYNTPKTLTFKAMDIPVLDGYDSPKTITFTPDDIPHLADLTNTITIGVTDGVPV